MIYITGDKHGDYNDVFDFCNKYKTKKINNGVVYYEEKYPNILFAKDGEIYDFDGKSTLVIGGAYSVDKYYRLAMGYNWYSSEQPSEETKNKVKKVLKEHNNEVDIILSHTCPFKYMPYEVFMSGVDQSKVDKSTEEFLDEIENNTQYKRWYCGHYHTDKQVDKIKFMMYDIDEFK